ncbi:PepSY domain-containing protein [Oscillochloris sp. ZM17-4]|uniref:PepSY domain-containing protein n=1 Tax=Oscillochloris sp. ZM17-4 TaxID=2866714 RepID=UPI001C737495|nr:PepSY domain-containing protein [Oscillochloris sp. ZM17-4]MBX0328385.1 PepSY domain-containing protein [Oscillochloris sp. ZM17-4]
MQRWIRIFAPALALAVVLTVGLAALGSNRASAHQATLAAAPAQAQAQPQPPAATVEPSGGPDTDTVEQQDGPQDTADGPEAAEAGGADNEAADAAALAGKAAISEQQARDAALAANPGATVTTVSLDDENGTVVYSVELSSGADVKWLRPGRRRPGSAARHGGRGPGCRLAVHSWGSPARRSSR